MGTRKRDIAGHRYRSQTAEPEAGDGVPFFDSNALAKISESFLQLLQAEPRGKDPTT